MMPPRPPFSHRAAVLPLVVLLLASTTVGAGEPVDLAEAEDSLRRAEMAFARTMVDRDHAAFTALVADDAVFLGQTRVYRGRDAVAAAWKPLFEAPEAPFSWAPDRIAVLEGGDLGLSSGPILDPGGTRVGTFNSVWRRRVEDGRWEVILDLGCPPCSGP
jgi:ketosteroid isomerase-like protein